MRTILIRISLIVFFLLVSCTTFTPIPTETPVSLPTHTNEPKPIATSTETPSTTPSSTSPPTLQPSQTPLPSNTPTATATVNVIFASDTLPQLEVPDWPIVLADDFSTNENGWPIIDLQAEKTAITEDTQYKWWAKAKDWNIFWRRPISYENLKDFYVSVDAKYIEGTGLGNYGLIFRHDASDYYIFVINDEGWFTIGKVVSNQYEPIVIWSIFSGIKPGETNQLAVIGIGSRFNCFINGYQVASISDTKITKGKVALAMLLFENGDESTFLFDNFELRAPQE